MAELIRREEFGSDRDTLFLLSGIALVMLGTGMILSNPGVRRYLGQAGVGDMIRNAIPDIERYFRLRSM
jgi:hypothetical protein